MSAHLIALSAQTPASMMAFHIDVLPATPVTVQDLRDLLEVAMVQMDDNDPDVADAYGLAEGRPEVLFDAAKALLDALNKAPCR